MPKDAEGGYVRGLSSPRPLRLILLRNSKRCRYNNMRFIIIVGRWLGYKMVSLMVDLDNRKCQYGGRQSGDTNFQLTSKVLRTLQHILHIFLSIPGCMTTTCDNCQACHCRRPLVSAKGMVAVKSRSSYTYNRHKRY